MSRRVVITGIGLVTPVGLDAPSTWAALLAGRSGVGPITKFDASRMSSRIAGEVRGFDPHAFIERKEARKMDTFSHYAIAATREALDDAALTIDDDNAERIGVYIGSGIGGLPLLEKTHSGMIDNNGRISPFFIPGMILNLAAGNVSILYGMKGPNLALATACATGSHAIGESYSLIREGYCDAMLAGGTEAVVTPLAVGGFCAMKALSSGYNDQPEKASRPFDADRDGFVIGEGAGLLVLEELAFARARGARVYAEITGYGLTGDAYHISAPAPDGSGAIRAMRMALGNAGIEPGAVDYINAHGTSTPAGDKAETQAVKQVFGAHARELAFASTKSMTGHLLGAAGGLETAVAALAIHHDEVPPTINQDTPDPDCDLDAVPNVSRKMPVRVAMNNSFGFGGTNCTLVLAKPPA